MGNAEEPRASLAVVSLQPRIVVLVIFEPGLWVVTVLVVEFEARHSRGDEAGDLGSVAVTFLLFVLPLRRRRIVDVTVEKRLAAAIRRESDGMVFLPAVAAEVNGIEALDLC